MVYGSDMLCHMEMTTLVDELNNSITDSIYCELVDRGVDTKVAYDLATAEFDLDDLETAPIVDVDPLFLSDEYVASQPGTIR